MGGISSRAMGSSRVPFPMRGLRGSRITPHDQYSSSIGVLGCYIDTNRVAYFPFAPGCNNLCVHIWSEQADLYLLHVDQSGGAFDISYDAWNFLNVGESAITRPSTGGGISVGYKFVDMAHCASLVQTPDGKLPLMAANSMNYYTACMEMGISEKSTLYNIQDASCTLGYNEICFLDLLVSNQPSCPHILGSQEPLEGLQVKNIVYGSSCTA
ncbi:hypothetical protein BU24DRAFT_441051 [Aaosphaeria arxii CBS 175.79]|uniref:Uncharacterized protein n=1 Tax=Aaosphaeria arxii CBS 175.79 TaxID=1450172 RepID=A0A6A5Y1U3_9PLEO|nr:uncharacterized protein BU24DRAFT_441051 [Aaosphaeria arxii CBS 175.79]KAF2018524.1 hypothetical protein BU24DRAFT_441051 [Aaosphaeria arxii CBS 175.79]